MQEHETSAEARADVLAADEGSYVDLVDGPRAAGGARRIVRAVLLAWELPALLDILLLVATELVTNAVRHGRPPVRMRLTRTPTELRLHIRDTSSTAPVHRDERPETDAETGRGVDIVAALADEFGWEQLDDGGKIVYASFTRSSEPGRAGSAV